MALGVSARAEIESAPLTAKSRRDETGALIGWGIGAAPEAGRGKDEGVVVGEDQRLYNQSFLIKLKGVDLAGLK